ncbi:CLUMA_CG004535, isoform A [Clunio marinus]|uniref:CLUMA_CG004535, isoform A n=1 Tax=Clunio marinus TaxID=568069 RepID=A0A1J1HS52_9DIPT|nr:CLUMA_CG004535, isoform A [Clunio marinus]
MFLQSITVCGFLHVKDTKTLTFDIQKNSEIHFKEIANVTDNIFIKALSIIFDKKYGSGYDLRAEFINNQCNGKSYVRIEFWQSDNNILNESAWLKGNSFKIERSIIDQSKIIKVNEADMDIVTFHNSMARLGFHSIEDFCMHRLLESEIIKLNHYNGEDLWNLILNVNQSEDLVQVLGSKHRKRLLLIDEMKRTMDEMEDSLASKLRLKNDMRTYFSLVKHFNTLMRIVSKRKLKILSNENMRTQTEIDNLMIDLEDKTKEVKLFEDRELKTRLKNCAAMKFIDLMYDKRDKVMQKLHEVKLQIVKVPKGFSIIELFHTIAANQTSIRENFQQFEAFSEQRLQYSEANLIPQQMEVEMMKWKIFLSRTQNKNLLDQFIETETNRIYSLNEELHKVVDDMEKCKEIVNKVLFLNVEQIKEVTKEWKSKQFQVEMEIAKLSKNMLKNEKEKFQIDVKINEIAVENELDLPYIQTLKIVEEFIRLNSDFDLDYVGPVFTFLNPLSEIDGKLWPLLSSVAGIFLFTRGMTARKVHRKMLELNPDLKASYVFLGIDEYIPVNYPALSEEMLSTVRSANELIDPKAKFKNILKQLLSDILLINEDEVESFEDISCLQKVIIHSKYGSTIKSNHCLMFQSKSSNENPIQTLKTIYEHIKMRIDFVQKINEAQRTILEFFDVLKASETQYQHDIHSNHSLHSIPACVAAFHQLLRFSEKKFSIKKRLLVKNATKQALEDLEALQMTTNDVNEIFQEILSKQKKLKNDEKQLETIEVEINKNKIIYELTVTKMEHSNDFLIRALHFVKYPWNEFYDDLEPTVDNFIRTNENLLESYKSEINQLQILTNECSVEKLQQEVELLKLKCKLYENRSKQNVNEFAMKKCTETIDLCINDPKTNFDLEFYNQYRSASSDELIEVLSDYHRQLQQNSCNIKQATKDQYGHLVDSIKKVEKYSHSPVEPHSRSRITSKTFPIVNKVFVKTLKDAVFNYRASFMTVMNDHVQQSMLLFYTRKLFHEIQADDFSWSCFDLNRIKAMDFVVNWKNSSVVCSESNVKTVKGLLLIMHIIHYLSVFKFIVIDEKIFNGMDEKLKDNLMVYLNTVSSFVQIIFLNNEVEESIAEYEDEPMDTS